METVYCFNLIRIAGNLYIHIASILLVYMSQWNKRWERAPSTCAVKHGLTSISDFFLKRMKNTNEYDDCLYLSDDLISEWWLLISKQQLISRWYLSVGILPGHHTPDSVGR